MKTKTFRARIEFKAEGEGEPGEFSATFATLNVIDLDDDVIETGAVKEGQAVRVAYWGHGWGKLPVGRGELHSDAEKAWIDGQFFLDTIGGLDTYKTVKHLDELQEWSFGFDILASRMGQFEGQDVQFLEELDIHEVSPVMLGAGIGTETTAIKGAKGEGSPGAGEGAGDGADGQGDVGNGAEDVVPSGPVLGVRVELLDLMLMEDRDD